MLVLLEPINVKSQQVFKSLLDHHKLGYTEIQSESWPVFQLADADSDRIAHADFKPFIRDVLPMKTPYQLVSRHYKKQDTVVTLGHLEIGGRGSDALVMAGPCAVEKRATMEAIAKALKALGVSVLRGGAFKPRTSPYSYQGMGEEGLEILSQVAKGQGMCAVSEVLDVGQMDAAEHYLDCIQIGARSMQNFELLRRAGKSHLPILLKRGPSATIEEFLLAAEYIYVHGNSQIILCERGIKTFETMTRNTFDINAVALLKQLSHLPVVADPSHGTGLREAVVPVGLSAIAAGANGLLIEAHVTPDRAVSDGFQTIDMKNLEKLLRGTRAMREVYHGIGD